MPYGPRISWIAASRWDCWDKIDVAACNQMARFTNYIVLQQTKPLEILSKHELRHTRESSNPSVIAEMIIFFHIVIFWDIYWNLIIVWNQAKRTSKTNLKIVIFLSQNWLQATLLDFTMRVLNRPHVTCILSTVYPQINRSDQLLFSFKLRTTFFIDCKV
jgi:hypothetical protein